uniref:Uncharacterized protein n=1 Tax=Oryza alta TaxID=52545 RepID=A0A1V1H773_9ORYZ|nr:hypothetical protein [Oryza alta]
MERRSGSGGGDNGGEQGAGGRGAGGGAEHGAAGGELSHRRPRAEAAEVEVQLRVPSLMQAKGGAVDSGGARRVAPRRPGGEGTFLSRVATVLRWVWVWSGLWFVCAAICTLLSWVVRPVVYLWRRWRALVVDEHSDYLCEAAKLSFNHEVAPSDEWL